MSPTSYQAALPRDNKLSDPCGIRTHDTSVKGWCLNHLTNGSLRRRRDSNPRTACAIYTLSRGASSATWVLLQIHCIQFWIAFISDAFEIILYEFTFVNAFFHFFQLFILYLTWLTETLFFLSPVFLLILKKPGRLLLLPGLSYSAFFTKRL